MSEEQEPRDAKLNLKLKAKSGYTATGEYMISVDQWTRINAILEEPRLPPAVPNV